MTLTFDRGIAAHATGFNRHIRFAHCAYTKRIDCAKRVQDVPRAIGAIHDECHFYV